MLFFKPYLDFILGASYNVMQTLEALGLWTTNFVVRDNAGKVVGSYWSTTEAITLPFFIAMVILVFMVCVMLLAVKILAGKKGVLIGIVIIPLPGFLSITGVWPNFNWLPDQYVLMGAGSLGGGAGMLAVLLLGLCAGWETVVIATYYLRLGEKFRHGYDHVWYALAVLTGAFFVTDLNSTNKINALRDENQVSKGASIYLLQQVRRLAQECTTKPMGLPSACHWANQVQRKLESYSDYGPRLYWHFGPMTTAEIYSPNQKPPNELEIMAIRSELEKYNQKVCPVVDISVGIQREAPVSNQCAHPPADYCTALAEPLKSTEIKMMHEHGNTVAIANECIIPLLIRTRSIQETANSAVQNMEFSRHLRWLLFILLAILAGGKVANATARLASLRKGDLIHDGKTATVAKEKTAEVAKPKLKIERRWRPLVKVKKKIRK